MDGSERWMVEWKKAKWMTRWPVCNFLKVTGSVVHSGSIENQQAEFGGGMGTLRDRGSIADKEYNSAMSFISFFPIQQFVHKIDRRHWDKVLLLFSLGLFLLEVNQIFYLMTLF